MLIPYKTFGRDDRLPFVSLTLKGAEKSATMEAFVDSGADFSIFHAGWMSYLGLSKRKAQVRRIQVGDGDYIRAFLFLIDVDFYGYSFQAPITFSENLGPGFNLLGRHGFFNKFRFCFDDKHFRLTIHRL